MKVEIVEEMRRRYSIIYTIFNIKLKRFAGGQTAKYEKEESRVNPKVFFGLELGKIESMHTKKGKTGTGFVRKNSEAHYWV